MPESVPVLTTPALPVNTYTSIPTSITAIQWDGTDETSRAIRAWAESADPVLGAVVDTDHIGHLWDYDAGAYVMPSGKTVFAPYGERCLIILTLEGEMVARYGDWIIKGTEGEFYPCKDSVFQRKYRPAAPAADGDSSIQLQRHEYAGNSFEIHHFTGKLLTSREDLEELYRQLDSFLYPNPGFEPRIAEAPRG